MEKKTNNKKQLGTFYLVNLELSISKILATALDVIGELMLNWLNGHLQLITPNYTFIKLEAFIATQSSSLLQKSSHVKIRRVSYLSRYRSI